MNYGVYGSYVSYRLLRFAGNSLDVMGRKAFQCNRLSTCLEYLYELLTKSHADFSWCGVHNTFEKEKMVFDDLSGSDDEFTISGKDLLLREDLRIMYSKYQSVFNI